MNKSLITLLSVFLTSTAYAAPIAQLDCGKAEDIAIAKIAKKAVKKLTAENLGVTMVGIGDCSPVAACGVTMGFVSPEEMAKAAQIVGDKIVVATSSGDAIIVPVCGRVTGDIVAQ